MERRIARIMRRSKGTIYLEPRSRFDAALIDTENVVYDFDLILEVLMQNEDWDYKQAIDWYCFNIEPPKYYGLAVQKREIDG